MEPSETIDFQEWKIHSIQLSFLESSAIIHNVRFMKGDNTNMLAMISNLNNKDVFVHWYDGATKRTLKKGKYYKSLVNAPIAFSNTNIDNVVWEVVNKYDDGNVHTSIIHIDIHDEIKTEKDLTMDIKKIIFSKVGELFTRNQTSLLIKIFDKTENKNSKIVEVINNLETNSTFTH